MNTSEKWRALGWRHPLWDYVRFYSVVQTQKKELRQIWTKKLQKNVMEIDKEHDLPVAPKDTKLFFEYLDAREADLLTAMDLLRAEEEALSYCERLGVEVTNTRTRSQDHHQSSKALVAAVSYIAGEHRRSRGLEVDVAPTRRCVWLEGNQLHVTARNLDGALPSLESPEAIWEIKEYWGKTKGGSKMSDAVYECALVGRELREFEERTGAPRVSHIVFVDGKEQWSHRRSDLRRFIDLFHQGIVDHLFVGRDVETEWQQLLGTRFS